MKKLLLLINLFIFISPFTVFSQEMVTAVDYFDTVSEVYGEITDYEAHVIITQGSGENAKVSEGILSYKTPNLLRIDFSNPKDQVICVTGEKLMIYIPSQVVVMTQKLQRHGSAALATMVSKQGLNLLKQGYSISYLESPTPVSLDEGSDEMVTKLKLGWRTTEQGFREIEISINDDKMIRRLKALTPEMEEVQFDFIGIEKNQGIPDTKFEYEAPASAYEINNFLFDSEG